MKASKVFGTKSGDKVLKINFTKTYGKYAKQNKSKAKTIRGMDNKTQESIVTYVIRNKIDVLYSIPRPTFEELQEAAKAGMKSREAIKWVYQHRYKEIVYWGNLTEKLKEALSWVECIIHIDPDYTSETTFDTVEKLPKSDLIELPKTIETAAYRASNEIRGKLAESGLHETGQFEGLETVLIQTTVEEIGLIWELGGRFRTGFVENDRKILLPVIFTVIKGAPNVKEYQKLCKRLGKIEYGINVTKDIFKVSMLYDNKIINVERFMKNWKYNYLDLRTQKIIMNAMLRIIDEGFDKEKTGEVVLGLSQNIINGVNGTDFSERIPKMVIEHTRKRAFNDEEVIWVYLLHLMGFDVVILSPKGYLSIENNLGGKFTLQNNGVYLEDTSTQFQKLFRGIF